MLKRTSMLLTILFLASIGTSIAKDKVKIIYKYEKYQKFDFEDMFVEGGTDSPGDLSINTRMQKKFKNKLPYRRTFIKEIRKGIERVR